MSGLDSGFLEMESGNSLGHMTGVLIVDPSTSPVPWTFERYREHLRSRLHLLPVYRKKLHQVPFGLDQPYWVPDDDFDLDYHLRSAAVPGDGGREAFADFVARIHERQLDRTRPLWECYVIQGVDGDKVALLSKIHHCAIDGQGGVEMLSAVLDLTPETPERPDNGDTPVATAPPKEIIAARAALNLMLSPVRMARAGLTLAKALPVLGPTITRPSSGAGTDESMVEALRHAGTAPRTPFNTVVGPHRRFTYSSVPLAAIKAVKNAADATVNDVVMAVVGGVLRRWLIEHDALPKRSLLAMVPLSVRPDNDGSTGNQVSSTIASLATHLEDPVERLVEVQRAMAVAKKQHNTLPDSMVTDIADLAPPAVGAMIAKVIATTQLARWVTLPYNVVVSNVAGPPFPLYLAGAKVVENLPVSAINDGVGLNITVQSTDDSLSFGFVSDRELIPDLWTMADAVEGCLQELADAFDVEIDLDR